MPTSVAEARTRLAELKSQGKTESTSKEAGKLAAYIKSSKDSGSSSSYGGTDFSSILSNAKSEYNNTIAPAVQTLQSSVDPLKSRYSELINSITGREQAAVDQTTLAQANELARRGISSTSGLGENTIAQAVTPVRSQFAGLTAETGLQQEKDLANIQNAIAQLQAGAGENAITTALSLYNTAQQQAQFEAQQQAANRLFEQVTLPSTQYELNRPYYKSETSSGSGGLDLSSFMSLFGVGGNTSSSSSASSNSTAPNYTPMYSGATSSDGQWVFNGYDWVPSYFTSL